MVAPDLLQAAGVAVSTVGFIIASAILLSNITTKFVALSNELGLLTEEYRRNDHSAERRCLAGAQIRSHRRRLARMWHATAVLNVAILLFIVTVLSCAAALVFPGSMEVTTGGFGSMVAGLVLLAVATGLELWQNALARTDLAAQLEDLPDLK